MKRLIVVEHPRQWPFELENVEVVAARSYLVEPRFAELERAAVYNLCRRLGYGSVGYYVSLLATARGHRPLPSVATSQALRQFPLLRAASVELDGEIQRALSHLRGEEFVLSVYFGRNVAKRYDRLARALFNQFPAPYLIARFQWVADGWRMASLRLGDTTEIPEAHRSFVIESAQRFFHRGLTRPPRTPQARYDLAVLWSPDDPNPPSDERAIRRFVRAAARQGIAAELVGPDDYGRIAEYDALFIRQTTYVNHHTYRFATRAQAEGLVVIDDPEAIVRTTNKVYQAEAFARHGIPTPRTHVMHDGNADELADLVGLPCVLKKPDGAFSQGVVKVRTPEEARHTLRGLLEESELIVAQAFAPTAFDWRAGVLDHRVLFACRYYMARGHWQIVSRSGARARYGKVEPVALEDAPPDVLDTALRAASLFGDGLFGVDLKEVDGHVVVMEVNDNPNLDAGYEDALLGAALYDAIAEWFRVRLDRRGTEEAT